MKQIYYFYFKNSKIVYNKIMQIMISGGYRKENTQVYSLIDKGLSVAYLPSWFSKESQYDFKRFKKQFLRNKLTFFPLERLTKKRILKMFSSDIIYIEGGNTYLLLHYVRKHNLYSKFRRFVKNKTLVGMSAGAIIQTPNINLAGVPHFNSDENLPKITNCRSLNLVNFEMFPHFEISDKRELKELINYSKKNEKKQIYLLPNGSSIIVNKQRKFIGKYWSLLNGKIIKGKNFIKK